jgi:hypothetical protein
MSDSHFSDLKSYEERAEFMKSLSLDFGADIINIALPESKCNLESTDPCEPIFLGMFIVNHSYFSLKREKRMSKKQIEYFHITMDNFFINDIFLKTTKNINVSIDIENIEKFLSGLSILLNKRYEEYYNTFILDFEQKSKIFRNTSKIFSNHFFIKEVPENQLIQFYVETGFLILFHLKRCLSEEPLAKVIFCVAFLKN